MANQQIVLHLGTEQSAEALADLSFVEWTGAENFKGAPRVSRERQIY